MTNPTRGGGAASPPPVNRSDPTRTFDTPVPLCAGPPARNPTLPTERLPGESADEALLRLAATLVEFEARFRLQLRELCRGEPSELVQTLAGVGLGAARASLALVATSGSDSALSQGAANLALAYLDRAEAVARGEGRRRTKQRSRPVRPAAPRGVSFEATPERNPR